MFRKIVEFEKNLRDLIGRLGEELRWKIRHPHASREDVHTHTFKQMAIVMVMVDTEILSGNPHRLDYYHVLRCAFTHDWGESIGKGDVSRPIKTAADEAAEEVCYRQVVATTLPSHLTPHFPLPIDRDPQTSPEMKEFWEAAEFIGYVMFALEEARNTSYPEEARASWRDIASYYQADLEKAATKFAGVRLFVEGLYS